MLDTRTPILVLLVVATIGIAVGTSGGTSFVMTGDTSAEVVDDNRAYVGYQSSDLTASDGETVDMVTVTNRGSNAIKMTGVTIADGSNTLTTPTSPDLISPGEKGTIQATADCTPSQSYRIAVTVSVTASGDAFGAHLSGDTTTRSFELKCQPNRSENETESKSESS